jgi:WD40 repeat protein
MRKAFVLTGFVVLLAVAQGIARPQMILPAKTPPPPTPITIAMAVSPDGKLIALGWDQRGGCRVDLLSAATGRGAGVLLSDSPGVGAAPASALAFSPDSKKLAAASVGTVRVWDATKSGADVLTISTDSSNIRDLAFSADGKAIVTAGDGWVKRWDAADGKLLGKIAIGSPNQYSLVALARDGKFALSIDHNATIHVWNVESGARARTFHLPADSKIERLQFSVDGAKFLANVQEPIVVRRFTNAFRAETEWVNKTIVVDRQTGARLCDVPMISGDPHFSASGKSLVTSDSAGIRVWNSSTGKLIGVFAKETNCHQLVASPDGSLLVGRMTNGVSAWNPNTGERVLGRDN